MARLRPPRGTACLPSSGFPPTQVHWLRATGGTRKNAAPPIGMGGGTGAAWALGWSADLLDDAVHGRPGGGVAPDGAFDGELDLGDGLIGFVAAGEGFLGLRDDLARAGLFEDDVDAGDLAIAEAGRFDEDGLGGHGPAARVDGARPGGGVLGRVFGDDLDGGVVGGLRGALPFGGGGGRGLGRRRRGRGGGLLLAGGECESQGQQGQGEFVHGRRISGVG